MVGKNELVHCISLLFSVYDCGPETPAFMLTAEAVLFFCEKVSAASRVVAIQEDPIVLDGMLRQLITPGGLLDVHPLVLPRVLADSENK